MNYLGNGTLFALLDGQNIQYLCPYGSPSFLQTSCTEALISRLDGAVCHAQSPEVSAYDGRVTRIDALHEGCLVRYIETTKPLTISLILPGYCRIYPCPDLKHQDQLIPAHLLRVPAGIPTGCGCSSTEQRMLVTVIGDAVFSEDGRALQIMPGRCAILFVYAHPSQLAKEAKHYLALLDAPKFTQSRFYRLANNRSDAPCGYRCEVSDTLLSLCCHSGGVISGHGENCVYTADLPIAGRALLLANYKEKAYNVANFLLGLWKRHGYLPLYASPTQPCAVCEKTDTECSVYPSVALFFHELIEDGVEPKLKRELEKAICAMIDIACTDTVAGELSFCPLSFSMRHGDLPPEKQCEANALATSELLYLLALYPRPQGQTVRDAAALHLPTDFPLPDLCVSDPHRLARCRLPSAIYGPCPACGDFAYVGWLTRAKFGAYLCPSCYGKGMREWQLAPNEAVLPGSFAAYITYLHKARLLDYKEYCRTLDRCAEAALEKAEHNSFYELCLLLPPLREVGSPHHATLSAMVKKLLKTRSRRPLFAAEAAAYLLANIT